MTEVVRMPICGPRVAGNARDVSRLITERDGVYVSRADDEA
jgi:hypothetical protein